MAASARIYQIHITDMEVAKEQYPKSYVAQQIVAMVMDGTSEEEKNVFLKAVLYDLKGVELRAGTSGVESREWWSRFKDWVSKVWS